MFSVPCDITDAAQVEAAIAAVVEHFGALDIVINNAGIGAEGDIAANGDDEWARVLDVNVVGLARVSRAALPHLRAVTARGDRQHLLGGRRDRRSATGRSTRPARARSPPLTLAMAADHVAEGIRVNAVTPGTADTPWVGRLLDNAGIVPWPWLRCSGANRWAGWSRPTEVAHAIAYLASPLSASTTGTLLAVDGGMSNLRI